MGEYADMIIDGTSCQHCGVFIGPGEGFPRTCSDCRKEAKPKNTKSKAKPFECSFCQKRFTTKAGAKQHALDVHGIA